VDRPIGLPLGASEEGARVDGLVQVGFAAACGDQGRKGQKNWQRERSLIIHLFGVEQRGFILA
jgi:hypothetical protein